MGGAERRRRRREDKSEKALLTLAVSQAICVTMLHVLLEGRSAGNRDIMVSRGKKERQKGRKGKKRGGGVRAAPGKILPDRASGAAGKATTVRTPPPHTHKGSATLRLHAA